MRRRQPSASFVENLLIHFSRSYRDFKFSQRNHKILLFKSISKYSLIESFKKKKMQSTLSPNSPVNSLGSGFGSASISPQIRLTVRQQPKHSRMCGFGEKVDRRPIDPPPIIEMSVLDPATDSQQLSQHQLYVDIQRKLS